MTCKKATRWLQLYLDGRLDRSRFARLEHHLQACAACREERALLEQICDCASETELVVEPADLTERILSRVGVYEAERVKGIETVLPGVPAWALSWRGMVVALVLLAGLAFLVERAAVERLLNGLQIQVTGAYNWLLLPGPDSIMWGIWAGGLVAALLLTVWFVRADASSSLRRAIAERLPQLW